MLEERLLRRTLLSLACFFVLLAIVLFLPGRLGWLRGWLFLAVFLLEMLVAIAYLWHKNPDIFVARSRIQKGTKRWDQAMLSILLLAIIAIFPLAGLNERYGPSAPFGVVVLGYVLLSLGMLGMVWVEAVNKFAEPGVRIQTERGHKVVDTGPYGFVRHPMYAVSFPLLTGMALALGSFWALIPAAVASILLIVRTVLEDRTLQNELEGYKEYASRVRHKLVPGVW